MYLGQTEFHSREIYEINTFASFAVEWDAGAGEKLVEFYKIKLCLKDAINFFVNECFPKKL